MYTDFNSTVEESLRYWTLLSDKFVKCQSYHPESNAKRLKWSNHEIFGADRNYGSCDNAKQDGDSRWNQSAI